MIVRCFMMFVGVPTAKRGTPTADAVAKRLESRGTSKRVCWITWRCSQNWRANWRQQMVGNPELGKEIRGLDVGGGLCNYRSHRLRYIPWVPLAFKALESFRLDFHCLIFLFTWSFPKMGVPQNHPNLELVLKPMVNFGISHLKKPMGITFIQDQNHQKHASSVCARSKEVRST